MQAPSPHIRAAQWLEERCALRIQRCHHSEICATCSGTSTVVLEGMANQYCALTTDDAMACSQEQGDEVIQGNRRLSSARAGPARVPAYPTRPATQPNSARSQRVSDIGARRIVERDLPVEDTDIASYAGSSAISHSSGYPSVSLGTVLKKIRSAKGQSDWEKKVMLLLLYAFCKIWPQLYIIDILYVVLCNSVMGSTICAI